MHNETIVTAGCDIAACLTVIGSLAGYLPDIAAGMAIIYYIIQFVRWMTNKEVHFDDQP